MPKLPSLRGCPKCLAELNPHTPVLVHGDNGMAPGISVLLGRSHVLHDTGQPGRELGLGTAEGEQLGVHGVQVKRPGAEHATDRSWACCTERRESAERDFRGPRHATERPRVRRRAVTELDCCDHFATCVK